MFLTFSEKAFTVSLMVYAAVFLLGLFSFLFGKKQIRGLSYGLFLLATIALGYGLFLQWEYTGMLPLTYLAGFFHLLALFCALLYLILGASLRLNFLDMFSAILVFVFSGLGKAIGAPDVSASAGNIQLLTGVHALTAFMSYASFGILALLSAQYLFQNYSLRRKKNHHLFKYMPSLQVLQEMSRRLLLIGLGLLTFSVILGWIDFFTEGKPDYLNAKICVATMVWLAYAVLFFMRKQFGANRSALCCVILFLFALAVFFLIHGKPDTKDKSPVWTEESAAT